jgi:uncharacterized damage-inducible protein DinB
MRGVEGCGSEGSPLGVLFLEQSRKYLATEYRTKLRCAVEALPPGMFWRRPNESSNSVGNLLLHLIGNLRQWIISGVGGAPDSRNRAAEFGTQDGPSSTDLLTELERTLVEVDRVLSTLTPSALLERRVIQGRNVTVFEAIFAVVQHFSQHMGQVIWIAKLHAPGAIQFVEDAGGLARPLWERMVRPPAR